MLKCGLNENSMQEVGNVGEVHGVFWYKLVVQKIKICISQVTEDPAIHLIAPGAPPRASLATGECTKYYVLHCVF